MLEIGAIVAIVTAVMQVIKKPLEKKYHPLVALGLGIVIAGGWAVLQGGDITQAIMLGVLAGLSSSGLYDQSKLLKAKKVVE